MSSPLTKNEAIRKLKTHAPLIYGVLNTEMGHEFSAISKEGIVYPYVGMLLSTDTEGYMPEFWGVEVKDNEKYNRNIEEFLSKNLEIIPYEGVDLNELVDLLREVESLIDKNGDE